jgi:AcrR family transcriptional regulator
MRQKNPAETRERIMRAATDQIAAYGLLDLTLDHVAEAAGVSKGGLLHHYPTKLALLEGLADHLSGQFFARLELELGREPAGSRGAWARAYIRATFDTPPAEVKLTSALAAALSAYPQLIDAYCAAFAALDTPHDDGLPPARQAMIRLACDGLAMAEVSGSPPIDAALRATLLDELMEASR